MKNAKDEHDRYLPLFKQGAISASTFDTKATALKVAVEDYNNAMQRLQELEKGPREQQIRAAKARLQSGMGPETHQLGYRALDPGYPCRGSRAGEIQ